MWAVIALLLAVTVIILLVYIFNMKKQLRTISSELDKTAENGYDRLVRISLFDEDVNEVASAVNREITHRKQLKMELQRTEESLRSAVSDIAHDLRTPLSVVKGDLQLIARSDTLDADSRHYVDICIAKTDEMKAMSDSFFELAVLESDTSLVELKKINMTNLLMQFIAENEGLIRLSGLEPDIVLPPKTVFVMGDEQFIMRILGNLLGNVVKYSCGSFRLELCIDGRLIMANPVPDGQVPDTEQLFERMYRGNSARQGSGAGLGLHIVKLLADKMQAKVYGETVENELRIMLEMKQ
ncbi:MAG: HAMP domain-containing histidine kinase [Ruminococcus sp.]|nr:HAMP domain-containing histidine kinase [Ruminococcus sp.]